MGQQYVQVAKTRVGSPIYEHIVAVEKALGKQLPDSAVVHHVNGDKKDNRGANLVACENQAYHMLLHRREKALEESGHAGWRVCCYCSKYDDPGNMWVPKTPGHSPRHRACENAYRRGR